MGPSYGNGDSPMTRECMDCVHHILRDPAGYVRCRNPNLEGPDLVFAVLQNRNQCGPERKWFIPIEPLEGEGEISPSS